MMKYRKEAVFEKIKQHEDLELILYRERKYNAYPYHLVESLDDNEETGERDLVDIDF